jgi:hypothetical protein
MRHLATILIVYLILSPIYLYATSPMDMNEPLIFSNYPEKIEYPQTVFKQNINTKKARIHFYHINHTSQRLKQTLLLKNNSNKSASINIFLVNGIHKNGSKLSFINSKKFWTNLLLNKKTTLYLRPNEQISLTKNTWLHPNIINHGILKIHNKHNANLSVTLAYTNPIYKKTPLNRLKPILFKAPKTYNVYIAPFGPREIITIGEKDTKKHAYNNGNYGQIHKIKIHFINPFSHTLTSSIFYNRISGFSRNNIIINNKKQLTTKKTFLKQHPERLTAFHILPHTTPTHEIMLFPESGNFYPIEIVVSSLISPIKLLK